VVGEDVRGGDRGAQVAGAEQRDVVLAGGMQDLADLIDQRLHVVADAPLAELAEARQVAADLSGVDVGVVGQLLGGDRLLAHLAGLDQDLQVAREPRRDSQRERPPAAHPFEHIPRVVAQAAALSAVENQRGHRAINIRSPVAYTSRARYSGYASGATNRAALAIIAALSVHSSRAGTCSST